MGDGTGIQWTDATKQCSRCGAVKPRSAFSSDKSRVDGLAYWCRDCRNERARSCYEPKGRPSRRGWLAPVRDGDRKQARRRINYLVEQGLLPRADDEPCVDCFDMLPTPGGRHEYDHAWGYDGENQLRVEPVCQRCHRNREEARRG